MQAQEARLRKLIEGTTQYVVPLFSRPYSWSEKQWKTLWDDVTEQAAHDDGAASFSRLDRYSASEVCAGGCGEISANRRSTAADYDAGPAASFATPPERMATIGSAKRLTASSS